MISLLPESYKDVKVYKQLFSARLNNDFSYFGNVWNEFPFLKEIVSNDAVIKDFLIGKWYTSLNSYYFDITYYFEMDDKYSTSHSLPAVDKPDGTKYYGIEDLIYCWKDADSNVLAKVFQFTIVDYDTIEVYCYRNSKTYTLYRD